MEWVQEIDDLELICGAPGLSLVQMSGDITIEDILPFMIQGGPSPPQGSLIRPPKEKVLTFSHKDNRPPKKYWELVKTEIKDLICGNSEKYAELRTRINNQIELGEKGIVALISAKVATILGLEAGAISGFCALCLFSAKSIGVNAFCNLISDVT